MFDAVGDAEVGAVGEVEDAVAKLVASETRPDLARLHALMNRLDAVWLRTLEEYDRSGAWAEEGFASPAAAIRTHCSIDQGSANHALSLARKLRQLPVLAETFAAGEIARGHVLAIANASTPGRPEFAGFEEPLTALATLTTPKGLAEKVREITDALDGDGGAGRFCEQYERRRFHLSKTMDGMWRGDFMVDPEAGATMQSILQTVGGPQPKGDDRSAAQFRADALFDVFRLAGKHARSKPGVRKPRADFTAVLTLDEIERRAGEVAIAIRASAHGLSRATLDRLLCDCNIARVITDGPSRVLDVGRTTKVWPDAIRRAIEIRDGGCTTPGCTRGPEWCDIHHVTPWDDGGETNLDNGLSKCRHHHVKEHEAGRGPP